MWDSLAKKLKDSFNELESKRKSDMIKFASVPHLFNFIKEMGPEDLMLLLDQARKIKKRKNPKIPPINADMYDTIKLLTEEEQTIVATVREFMLKEIQPIATEQWLKGEFPHHIIDSFKKLNIIGLTLDKSVGGQERSYLLEGMIGQELARTDVSICTFFGVHSGLAMNSIDLCGSDEQRKTFLPAMAKLEKIGAFALTEPDVGSAVLT